MRQELFDKILAFFIIFLLVETTVVPIVLGFNNINPTLLDNKKAISDNDLLFDLKIKLLMKIGHIPSISVCIIKNNTIVWDKGYGFYDRLLRKKPDVNTVYMAGSISKTITTAALMQLYEKGYFNLDDNVSKFLPFDLKNPRYPNINITFRMLLAHQSSLHDHNELSSYKYEFSNNYNYSYFKELLTPNGKDYHPEYWAAYPPGKEANYSNLGLILLGYIVERMTNQSLEQYCQKNIFNPLNMKNSSFQIDNLNRGNLAVPYFQIAGIYLRIPHTDFSFVDPAGGLYTTAEDLSHFLIAHMNGGVYNGIRILNESTINLMHTVQYPNSSIYIIYRFGLGWLIIPNENGEAYQGHDGDTICFHAKMRICDSNGNGVIFFYNVGSGPWKALRKIDFRIENECLYLIKNLLFEKARNI